MKKHDITGQANDYLYELYKNSHLYQDKDSTNELRAVVDKRFEYTPEQWEFLQVNFDFDLEERYS